MKPVARLVAPLLLAGAGLTVATFVPAAQAEHGSCADQLSDDYAANPHDPKPSVRPTPPAIDTASTVNYASHDLAATIVAASCVVDCVGYGVNSVVTNPHDPKPSVRPTPPAVDTASTFAYAGHDVDAVGGALRCVGVHDVM